MPAFSVTPQLGYGAMSLSPTFYGPTGLSEDQCIEVLQSAYEAGARLFNTSDIYDFGNNERYIGKALKGKPGVFIATKWGMQIVPGKGFVSDYSREAARKSCEAALERLQVSTIGLFTLRGPLPASYKIEDTMEELKLLVQEGKIQHLGVSEVSPEDVKRAHAVHPLAAVELEWSLFSRECEEDLIPICRERGISVLAYCPLGSGLLAGQIKSLDQLHDSDFRKMRLPRFANIDQNRLLVDKVTALAERKGCTSSQLALAWLLAKGDWVYPIPGTKNAARIRENMGALNVKLSADDVAQLEAAVPIDAVVGGPSQATYRASVKTGVAH